MDNESSTPTVRTEALDPKGINQKLCVRAKILNPRPFRHSNKGKLNSTSMKLDLANSYELVKEREKGKEKSKRYLFQEARQIWLPLAQFHFEQ